MVADMCGVMRQKRFAQRVEIGRIRFDAEAESEQPDRAVRGLRTDGFQRQVR